MINILISGDPSKTETLKGILVEGLREEKKKTQYAFKKTLEILDLFEKKYGISTSIFIEKFKNGEIEEDDNTFTWQAEFKIYSELEKKLNLFSDVEICLQ